MKLFRLLFFASLGSVLRTEIQIRNELFGGPLENPERILKDARLLKSKIVQTI